MRHHTPFELVETTFEKGSEKRKIKVAFFTDILIRDFDGAVETMYQIIDRIPDDRFEYLFICGVAPKQPFKHPVVVVPSAIIPFNISYQIALPGFAKHKIHSALHDFQPDVIHISTPSFIGFFALDFAKKEQIPVLSIYHTHFISYMKYYFRKLPFLIRPAEKLTARLYREFYNRCDLVYVPSHLMITELIRNGISSKRLKQWHRGLNTNLFNPGRKDQTYIRGITGNNLPCVLYASRIVWEKNIETLFRIYDKAEEQRMQVNFIVAGSGVAEPEAREHMKKAYFMGFLDQDTLGKLYASCDVFVFPSVSETYGNVVAEASACGCIPVIARGGGSQALVDDGKTGFLCEPGNPDDYIDKIKRVLDNEPLRQHMRSEVKKYIALLSWEHLTHVYFSDMEQLALNRSFSKNEG